MLWSQTHQKTRQRAVFLQLRLRTPPHSQDTDNKAKTRSVGQSSCTLR